MSRYLREYDEDIILRVIVAFLCEGKSHREIQRDILGVPAPARGGGFIAMDILHHYDIHGDKKGVLRHCNIDGELLMSSSKYEEALKKVSEYLKFRETAARKIARREFTVDTGNTEISGRTKLRVNQSVLREYVLDIYGYRCALCNIDKPDLLFCSHIKPWAVDSDNRLNPSNAICLCALHDRLFDRGYFSLDRNYKIIFGRKADSEIRSLFEGKEFRPPYQDPPDPEFLDYHYREYCMKS